MKKTIKANVWGKQSDVTLTTWTNIRKLGFKQEDRAFGTLNDGTPALFFNGSCVYDARANEGKDEWLVTTEDMNCILRRELHETISNLFKQKEMPYTFFVSSPNTVIVDVEWGDWKHDHIRLKYEMEQLGFVQVSEEVTEDNGSDTYSAQHIYMRK